MIESTVDVPRTISIFFIPVDLNNAPDWSTETLLVKEKAKTEPDITKEESISIPVPSNSSLLFDSFTVADFDY